MPVYDYLFFCNTYTFAFVFVYVALIHSPAMWMELFLNYSRKSESINYNIPGVCYNLLVTYESLFIEKYNKNSIKKLQ